MDKVGIPGSLTGGSVPSECFLGLREAEWASVGDPSSELMLKNAIALALA